ncbi:MAG: transcription elongation factor GreA [Bacteroidaceae bacterium]|nr:transcription elongation factor GreA [Bacteroidaceae bacterium]MBR3595247.1 transcription elongation factor GreA [Candidatus Saccharibacteria bacterium]MBR6122756.1 transcription elongation factor GreA [Candidatus Saccharibacteria bacterium]
MKKKTVDLTKEGKAELEKELKDRIAERETIKEKIATARAFGDLSENEDYSAARNEQKLNETRISEIEEILKNAKVIANRGHEKVGMGAKVTVSLGGKKYTYSVVGPVEANPLEGKISDASPIGKALLGKRAGDEYVLPNGNKGKIVSVE